MIWIFLIILTWHWIADFLLQTDWMALNKSTRWDALLLHTSVYSMSWIFLIGFDWRFIGVTFICHTITDYFTSRINAKLWKEGKRHDFFVMIGFDQLLHYTQILLTIYYLL